jgi:hypothetical protein
MMQRKLFLPLLAFSLVLGRATAVQSAHLLRFLLFLAAAVFQSLTASAAEDYFYDIPGTPKEHQSRIKIRHTGITLVEQIYVDKQPFAYFRLEEVSGNPHIYWLTRDKLAFLGCGGPHLCDEVWRVGDVNTRSQVQVELSGFDKRETWPVFRGSLMAYQGRLPNGNLGCFAYDWEKSKFLLNWDTGEKHSTEYRPFKERAEFSPDGKSVICRTVIGWKDISGAGEGQSSLHMPEYGKWHIKELRE